MTGIQNIYPLTSEAVSGAGPKVPLDPALALCMGWRRHLDWMDDMDRLREFKVHVPLHLHLRLHQHRLLNGQSLSATMQHALDAYFDKHLPDDPPT